MIQTLKYSYANPMLIVLNRGVNRMRRRSSNLLPLLVMPLFFLLAFSGSFSGLGAVEGFGTMNVVDWMLPWAALQGCAFAGLGTGSITADDLESGFYDRIFLAPVARSVLLGGLLGLAVIRAFIPLVLTSVAAIFLDASYPTGLWGIGMMFLAGIGIALIMSLLSLALVYKFKTQRILVLSQILVFVALFLSIGQTPIRFMQGWLPYVARVNPFTNIIRMSRQGLIGDISWADTWPGLLAILGMCFAFGYLSLRNLSRYDK